MHEMTWREISARPRLAAADAAAGAGVGGTDAETEGSVDIARHVIKCIVNPRFVSHMGLCDVVIDMSEALP